jgi:hypothetical protein
LFKCAEALLGTFELLALALLPCLLFKRKHHISLALLIGVVLATDSNLDWASGVDKAAGTGSHHHLA